MRVMVFGKATPDTEAGVVPTAEEFAAMGMYYEELVNAGILLDGAGLHPSARGVRIEFSGDERTVIDGPFAEAKELVAGFSIWQVRSMEEALEWARRCPNPTGAESVMEIRPIYEPEDFGDALTQEVHELESRLRAQVAAQQA
jgi:hypothetical protein